MKNISDNLSKKDFFKPLKKKAIICEILKKRTDLDITHDQLSFSNDILFISIRPSYKTYILEKEKDILEDLSVFTETNYLKKIV